MKYATSKRSSTKFYYLSLHSSAFRAELSSSDPLNVASSQGNDFNLRRCSDSGQSSFRRKKGFSDGKQIMSAIFWHISLSSFSDRGKVIFCKFLKISLKSFSENCLFLKNLLNFTDVISRFTILFIDWPI